MKTFEDTIKEMRKNQHINYLIHQIIEREIECNEVVWCMNQQTGTCYDIRTPDGQWQKFRELYDCEKSGMSSSICPRCVENIK